MKKSPHKEGLVGGYHFGPNHLGPKMHWTKAPNEVYNIFKRKDVVCSRAPNNFIIHIRIGHSYVVNNFHKRGNFSEKDV